MDSETLTKIGLTKNESIVYLSLLKSGDTTAGNILKNSGLNSGKIYDILEALKIKGLISESIIQNVRHFSPSSPKKLLDYISAKEKQIKHEKDLVNELMPHLNDLKSEDISVKAITYIGLEGMKTAIEELIDSTNPGEEILTMGVTGEKDERINNFWRTFFIPKIKEKKLVQKIIFSKENTEYLKDIKKFSNVRKSSLSNMTPIAIYGSDKVIISNYDAPITNIVIHSEKIAKSFIELFNNLWKLAKS